jgi:hypothetical protein
MIQNYQLRLLGQSGLRQLVPLGQLRLRFQKNPLGQ